MDSPPSRAQIINRARRRIMLISILMKIAGLVIVLALTSGGFRWIVAAIFTVTICVQLSLLLRQTT
ncbi:MAG TPA: hypothetical protein VFB21_00895 [Chthonomonadaceae bacterium]|nr:hypothetical protein [Chthonomonadaceae bacterium]